MYCCSYAWGKESEDERVECDEDADIDCCYSLRYFEVLNESNLALGLDLGLDLFLSLCLCLDSLFLFLFLFPSFLLLFPFCPVLNSHFHYYVIWLDSLNFVAEKQEDPNCCHKHCHCHHCHEERRKKTRRFERCWNDPAADDGTAAAAADVVETE